MAKSITAEVVDMVVELNRACANLSPKDRDAVAGTWFLRKCAAAASMADRDAAARLCRCARLAYDVAEQHAREREMERAANDGYAYCATHGERFDSRYWSCCEKCWHSMRAGA